MASCAFHSFWTQILSEGNRAKISSISSVEPDENGVCAIENCMEAKNPNTFCKLTAICTKLTGDNYMRSACPSCDNVRCDDGFDCTIGADNNLPQCTEVIPGGCEVNNCGRGECIENGTQYTCSCDGGFSFDGETCADVDECALSPCGNGECENVEGSYECDCMDGYTTEQGTCVDVNECLSGNPCGDYERCSNVEGSFICDCLQAFFRDGEGDCVCADGYRASGSECVDVDECLTSPCTDLEECTNTVGNYQCACSDGATVFPSSNGECVSYQSCDLSGVKEEYQGIRGNTIRVEITGVKSTVFKVAGTIVWTKDGTEWDPETDAAETVRGFTLYDFQPENAGFYEATVYLERKTGNEMCKVGIPVTILEGSADLAITNMAKFAKTLPASKGVAVQCKVTLTNLKLENAADVSNVNWYKVIPGEDDVLIEDNDDVNFNYKAGSYRLWFESPQATDSGTYKCEFNQQNVYAFVEITMVWE